MKDFSPLLVVFACWCVPMAASNALVFFLARYQPRVRVDLSRGARRRKEESARLDLSE